MKECNYREQNRPLTPDQGLWPAARCQAGTTQVTQTTTMNITTDAHTIIEQLEEKVRYISDRKNRVLT